MRKSNFNLAVSLSSALLLGATSCVVDGDFDGVGFDQIDTEMTLMGEGVAFPLGDVAPVQLGELLEAFGTTQNFLVTDAQGNYSLSLSDQVSADELTKSLDMDALKNIPAQTFSYAFDITLDIPYGAASANSGVRRAPGDLTYTVDETLEEFELVSADMFNYIPSELTSVTEVEFTGNKITFGIRPTKLPDWGTPIKASDFVIVLPDYAVLEDGTHELKLPDATLVQGQEIVGSAEFKAMKGREFDPSSVTKDKLVMKCLLTANNPSLTAVAADRTLAFDMRSLIGSGDFTSNGVINVTKISGKVDFDVTQDLEWQMDQIPASFRNEGTVLDLSPMMNLAISSNLDLALSADVTITPYLGGKPVEGAEVALTGLNLPRSNNPSQNATAKYTVGSDAKASDGVTAVNTALGGLLRTVPDFVKLSLSAKSDKTAICSFYSDAAYKCDMAYDLKVPLAPGKDFKLVLTPEPISLGAAGSYLKYIKENPVSLVGSVESSLPVGVTLGVTFLDQNKNEVTTVEPVTLKLSAAKAGVPANDDFELNLKFAQMQNTPAYLSFSAVIDAPQGASCLNKKDYIRMDDIVIILPDGITMNTNNK